MAEVTEGGKSWVSAASMTKELPLPGDYSVLVWEAVPPLLRKELQALESGMGTALAPVGTGGRGSRRSGQLHGAAVLLAECSQCSLVLKCWAWHRFRIADSLRRL